MLLRRLVTAWLQQTAQEKIQQAVSEATDKSRDTRSDPETEDSAATRQAEPPPCAGAFLFAAGVEAGGLVDLLTDCKTRRRPTFVEHGGYLEDQWVVVAESGPGHLPSAKATRDIITIHHPSWIVSAGFACALNKSLRRGHILMADEVVDERGERLAIPLDVDHDSVTHSPGLHLGRLLTVDHLVRTSEQRQKLDQQYQALACDMETMAVAQVCRSENVRSLAVRIISEEVDQRLPVEVEQLLEHDTLAGKLGVAAGAIFKRPSSVKDIWQLKEDAIKASDRLARFLSGLVKQMSDG
jgi:adenosylhomocysteine nucleosidase